MNNPVQMYALYVAMTLLSIAVIYLLCVIHRRITRQDTHYVFHYDTRLNTAMMDKTVLENRIDTMILRQQYPLKRFNPSAFLTNNCVMQSIPLIHDKLFKGSVLVATVFEEVPIYCVSKGCLAQYVAIIPLYHTELAVSAVLEPVGEIPREWNTLLIRNDYDRRIFHWILNGIASCQCLHTVREHRTFLKEVFTTVYALRKHFKSIHRLVYVPGKDTAHILMEVSVWDSRELERTLSPLYASKHMSFIIDRDRTRLAGPSVSITFSAAKNK